MEPSNAKLRTFTIRTTLPDLQNSNLSQVVDVKADDVALEEVGDADKRYVYHYNFMIDDITVASFPFNIVQYITSKP